MRRARPTSLILTLLLSSCSATQNFAAPGRDLMQEDMIAHPEKYVPKNAVAPRPNTGVRAMQTTRANSNAPSYCPDGSLAAEQASSFVEGLEVLRSQCRTGDSLVLHSYSTGLIASACDLNKPVSTIGNTTFCIMGTLRPMRPSSP